MSNKIAAIFNEAQELSTFEDGAFFLVFDRQSGQWQVREEIAFSLDTAAPISDIRDSIRTIILKLEDCNTLLVKSVSGLPYNILERMGFDIFEAEAFSNSLLEDIRSELDEAANASAAPSSSAPTSPVPTGVEGVYFLNLIELQEEHPEISSKKALQSFIEISPFYKLEVICSHIPPWFDTILPQRKLAFTSDEIEKNKLKVTIFKKVCQC